MIRVLHEDGDVVAVDKSEGIASIPERDLSVKSVQRELEAARGERLFVVHRLDKEVSGVLLFARNAEAHRALSLAFERREAEKTYLALLHGVLERDEVIVDRPIAQFGSGRMGVDERKGKPSRTDFVVLRRLARATLAEARPHTGRRHQIRVHAYAIGHPLVGDVRYGDRALQQAFPRVMLHARRLRISLFGRTLALEAPAPPSFEEVVGSMS